MFLNEGSELSFVNDEEDMQINVEEDFEEEDLFVTIFVYKEIYFENRQVPMPTAGRETEFFVCLYSVRDI